MEHLIYNFGFDINTNSIYLQSKELNNMASHVMVAQKVDLAKRVFNEVLDYQSRTGLTSCELHRVEDQLKRAGISFNLQNLSVAVDRLIAQNYVRLGLYRIRDDEDIVISLELTGKTARHLR